MSFLKRLGAVLTASLCMVGVLTAPSYASGSEGIGGDNPIVQDLREEVATTQWNLDRIDQRNLPLNGQYNPPAPRIGTTIYNIDSGALITHVEFQGRASYGPDYVDGGTSADCNGHGTHTTGTEIGATVGAAVATKVVEVRVLDCNNSGNSADVKSALNWVRINAHKPAVVNMSLGLVGCLNCGVDEAVQAVLNAGITVVASAGNDNTNACGQTPARVPGVITVASTTSSDARSSFSNYGPCVDLFAPGSSIVSSCKGSTTQKCTMSGTSMASPLVAGYASMILSYNTTWTPAQVQSAIVGRATVGHVSNPGSGTPNRLIYLGP